MPLTTRRFFLINGHSAIIDHDRYSMRFAARCECDCGDRPVFLASPICFFEEEALHKLLDQVLALHRAIVMERQGFACALCHRIGPLSGHHKILRSRNRDDRVANLQGLCVTCHEQQHQPAKGLP